MTRFARFGVDERLAAYWVGHKSVAMTRGVYTHIQAADLMLRKDRVVPAKLGSYSATQAKTTLGRKDA